MTRSTGLLRTGFVAGVLAAAFAAFGPQQARAAEYAMPGDAGQKTTLQLYNSALVSLKVEARYLSCNSTEAESKADKSWRTAAGGLTVFSRVSISYDSNCTLKIEVSCNGCRGRGQFETVPGESPHLSFTGSAFKWGVEDMGGVRQIGNDLAYCRGAVC